MTLYSGSVSEMAALRGAVSRCAGDIEQLAATAAVMLDSEGATAEALAMRHHVLAVEEWLRRWAASLDHRTGLLAGEAAPAAPLAHQAPPLPLPGDETAAALITSLQQGDLARTAQLLDALEGMPPDHLARFVSAFGVDMVALFPLLVLEQGVPAAELGRYLAPLAGALARALPTGAVGFGIDAVMHDAARSRIGPGAYFAFADFAGADLAAAAAALTAQFHRRHLPLHTPPYIQPDGSAAHPDPRLHLLELVLDREAGTAAAWVGGVVADTGAAAVVAPATPWGDGGEAAAAVLTSLAGRLDRPTVLAVAVAAVEGGADVAPALRLAAWRLLWASLLAPLRPGLRAPGR